MKRIAALTILACLVSGLLAGCAFSQSAQKNAITGNLPDPDESGGLVVYASFYTMKDFASKIGGEKIRLNSMMPMGADAHSWEPTPSQISSLESADVFIFNGAGMEHWAPKVLDTIRNQSLVVVATTAEIDLQEGTCENHDIGIFHTHDTDPHVWLDPMKAKQQMQVIRDVFVQADPQNSDYFNENFERYAAELDRLDAEFREALSGLQNRTIIVSHEAFGYLCDAYGLTQVGIAGLEPNTEPSPARMAQIIELVNQYNISVIFFDGLASSRVVDAIARETGTRTAVLSSLEGLTDEQVAAGDDYFSVMRLNLQALKEALR